MTLTQLQYIIAVDTHRHFGRAAESCFVTQPTLSMQLHKLEDELGLVLFNRSKQPVEPTEIGKKIIAQARIVLSEAEKIEQQAQAATGDISGVFKLGIIPTVAPNLIYRFINNFKNQLGDVQLIIEEMHTEQIIKNLYNNDIDAAILATPLEEKGIEEIPLYYEPFMAFVPDGHRLAKDDFVLCSELDIEDLLLLNKGHCFRNSVIKICQQNKEKEANMKLESGNFDTLMRLAKLGYGMTLIPYLTAIDLHDSEKKFIKAVAEPTPSREISLVYASSNVKWAILEKLAPIIRASVPKRLLFEKNEVITPM